MNRQIKYIISCLIEFPFTQQAIKYIAEKTNLLDDTFLILFKFENGNINKEYAEICERHLIHMKNMKKFKSFNKIFDNFISATINYSVKYPMQYIRSNKFGPENFDEASKTVYDNKEVMEGYYLDGLYLALIFWHGYSQVFNFFRKEVCTNLKTDVGRILDIGYGHGAYLLTFLSIQKDFKGIGIDISVYSKKYADDLRNSMKLSADKATFLNLDFFKFQPNYQFDIIISCEVLEHLEKPDKFLQKCKDLMKDDAKFMISIPIKSPAEDHLQFFNTREEIDDLLIKNGFIIDSFYEEKSKNPNAFSRAYACILRKK